MNDVQDKENINRRSMPSIFSKHRLLVFAVGVLIVLTASVVGYIVQNEAALERAEIASKQQRIAEEMERETQSLLDQQKRETEKKAALARANEWLARTVQCPKCQKLFTPEDNKAPLTAVVSAGTAAGAAAGGAAGTYAGAGTGVAVGGVGAFPGALIGGAIGGVGGGIVGGLSTAWHRDRQVKCPGCGEIFKNPKN